jgi:predicted nucleotidyltransferase
MPTPTILPAPLNLVATSPCLLALMSGFDRFNVDFFLMGDVAAHCRTHAEETTPESPERAEASPLRQLKETDFAIFIGDWVPYGALKEWLVTDAGFSLTTGRDLHLQFSAPSDPTPITVALIPFSEVKNQNQNWVPTGLGMAVEPDAHLVETLLGSAPIQATPESVVWQPVTLPEVMVIKLFALYDDVPAKALARDARDVRSIIENYDCLEQPYVRVFHHDVYPSEESVAGFTELQWQESYAEMLGREMYYTLRFKSNLEDFYELQGILSWESVPDYADPHNVEMVMRRPRYYGDPSVPSNADCRAWFSSMWCGFIVIEN